MQGSVVVGGGGVPAGCCGGLKHLAPSQNRTESWDLPLRRILFFCVFIIASRTALVPAPRVSDT